MNILVKSDIACKVEKYDQYLYLLVVFTPKCDCLVSLIIMNLEMRR